METYVTIKMTEDEYKHYREQQAALLKDHAEKETLQTELEKFSQMVCRALKRILDGENVHLGLRTASLLYDYADKLLRQFK